MTMTAISNTILYRIPGYYVIVIFTIRNFSKVIIPGYSVAVWFLYIRNGRIMLLKTSCCPVYYDDIVMTS